MGIERLHPGKRAIGGACYWRFGGCEGRECIGEDQHGNGCGDQLAAA